MRNSMSPVRRKKRKTNNFRPSISLAEFAEAEKLNLFALVAAVAASSGIKAQYSRNAVRFYHIIELRAWLSTNDVPACEQPSEKVS